VIGVAICFLHYSSVCVVVAGVDVVADNVAGLRMLLRTGRRALLVLMWRRCWRRHRTVSCVVRENIDAVVGSYHDRHVGRKPKGRQQNQPGRKLRSIIMMSVLGQQLWKSKLVAGVLSIVVAAVVLVWPFDSLVVLTLVCGVSLVILGVIRIVQALQIRKDTNTARNTIETLAEQVPA
jgi:Short repeat of unknown function (DUF308)